MYSNLTPIKLVCLLRRITYLPCLNYGGLSPLCDDKKKNCRAHLPSSSSPVFVFSEPRSNDSFGPTFSHPPSVVSPFTPGGACALCTVTVIGRDAFVLSYSRRPHFSGRVPQSQHYLCLPMHWYYFRDRQVQKLFQNQQLLSCPYDACVNGLFHYRPEMKQCQCTR